MKRPPAFVLAFIFFGTLLCAAQETYDDGYVPKPPAPFTAEFKDYQILPSSVSPNHQYALLYPKRSALFDIDKPRLCLVTLKPFGLVRDLPLRGSLASNAHGWYGVSWTPDSSAVIVTEGGKWGPNKVLAVPVNNGKAGSITDLTAEVSKEVQPDFNKAKPERFNDIIDFLFYQEDQKGWKINEKGQVAIDCLCTNDPKTISPKPWTVRFTGIWDLAQGKFIHKKQARLAHVPES